MTLGTVLINEGRIVADVENIWFEAGAFTWRFSVTLTAGDIEQFGKTFHYMLRDPAGGLVYIGLQENGMDTREMKPGDHCHVTVHSRVIAERSAEWLKAAGAG